MVKDLLEKKEKKVEYVELIYDLIFVYVIGRNNLLLHHFADGFVSTPAFLAYALSTLAVIQIWNYTTYYINVYGRHSVREHAFLFINMFLLYFLDFETMQPIIPLFPGPPISRYRSSIRCITLKSQAAK